jgi:hypothetical protein
MPVAACCRHYVVSGRALCTRAAPYTLRTGCGLALVPALARCWMAKATRPAAWPSRAGEALVTLTHRRSRETRSKSGRPAPYIGQGRQVGAGPAIGAPENTQDKFLKVTRK